MNVGTVSQNDQPGVPPSAKIEASRSVVGRLETNETAVLILVELCTTDVGVADNAERPDTSTTCP
jgi:hypothetical protein